MKVGSNLPGFTIEGGTIFTCPPFFTPTPPEGHDVFVTSTSRDDNLASFLLTHPIVLFQPPSWIFHRAGFQKRT